MRCIDSKTCHSLLHLFMQWLYRYRCWRWVVKKLQHKSWSEKEMCCPDSDDDEDWIFWSFQRRHQNVDENGTGEESGGDDEKPLENGNLDCPKNWDWDINCQGVSVETDDREKAGNVRCLVETENCQKSCRISKFSGTYTFQVEVFIVFRVHAPF